MDEEIKLYQSEGSELEPSNLINRENYDIGRLIFSVRDTQVILDKDLAKLYGVETKVLNQAAKRNIARFPEGFRFQLTKEECSRSQNVTLNAERGKNIKYLPYAYSEQGVAMLSAILKSQTAIDVSVKIMNAFVYMRRFLMMNADLFQKVALLEQKQLQTDQIIDEILNKLEDQHRPPTHGIFFDGQIFDAYQFVSDLIRSAKRSIVLFDNYADDSVLTQLAKRTEGVAATVCASRVSEGLRLDVRRHNAQYAPINLREVPAVHDRFLLIDDTILYTFGASFKDLGKKMFCFNKMESEDVIEAVRNALHNIDFDY